jgi:hypothetical protein
VACVAEALLAAEEPDSANATSTDLIDGRDLHGLLRDAVYSLLINDLVAKHHAVDQLGMEVRQSETILPMVLAECNLACRHRLASW